MDASLKADLQNAAFTSVTFASFALGAGTVRLTSGGDISYGGNSYSDLSATYGAISRVSVIGDGADDQIPSAEIVINLPSAAAKGLWSVVTDQGVDVNVYQATINRSTGAVIGAELLFFGEYNRPRFTVARGVDAATLICTSQLARLKEPNHERKLSDALHQSCFSGELGLSFVTRVTRDIPWRVKVPGASTATSGKTAAAILGF